MSDAVKPKKVVVNINVSSDSRRSVAKCLKEISSIIRSRATSCAGECTSYTSKGTAKAEFDFKVLEVEGEILEVKEEIKEGKVRKGGLSKKPSTSPPPAPKGQGE